MKQETDPAVVAFRAKHPEMRVHVSPILTAFGDSGYRVTLQSVWVLSANGEFDPKVFGGNTVAEAIEKAEQHFAPHSK